MTQTLEHTLAQRNIATLAAGVAPVALLLNHGQRLSLPRLTKRKSL
jgi:hypothetical protein